MLIELNEITVNSLRTRAQLLAYLNRMKDYPHFDENQMVKVFVNSDKDFTAFESCEYNLGFTSSAHKLIETIESKYSVKPMPFKAFYGHILAM